ncbi:MAG: hypothetical protein HY661_20270 [Betaproteobacteria bacterium]|nr:hypothetical protein [Betaproteobacteria bacterium]
MKNMSPDYSLYDIPELAESEFALSVSPCPRIEDCSGAANAGASPSIGSIVADALFRRFEW